MHVDPYKDLAERYDRFFEAFTEHDPARVSFFRSIFDRYGVRRVLDCACGTGHDLHLFKALGCDVHGSDVSRAMLAQARRNAQRCEMEVSLEEVDFRELPRHFRIRFDAVVCLSSSLPHLVEDSQLIRALASMREVLRDTGVLVLSQGMSDKRIKERPRYIPVINTRDFSRIFAIEYHGETYEMDVLDVLHTENERTFHVATVRYRILLRDDYDHLLNQAGFADRQYYGNYLFEPYDAQRSDRMVVVAQR